MNEIFGDVITQIGNKIGKTDTAYKTKIKDFFNDQYEKVWSKYLWKSSIVFNESIVATNGSADLYLPKTVDEVLALTQRSSPSILIPYDVQVFHRNFIDEITTGGLPEAYTFAGEFSAKAQPDSAERIKFVSSTTDTGTIRIWGLVSGEEITELITLTSTTPVLTTNSFTQINRIAKSAVTAGVITVSGNTSSTTFLTLAPSELTARHKKVSLLYVPNSALTMYLTYKKQWKRMVNDQDIFELPVLGPLKRMTYADCLREQRQAQKAALEEAAGNKDLEDYVSQHQLQSDQQDVAQPDVMPFEPDVYGYGNI